MTFHRDVINITNKIRCICYKSGVNNISYLVLFFAMPASLKKDCIKKIPYQSCILLQLSNVGATISIVLL